jgi:hypothetical protein
MKPVKMKIYGLEIPMCDSKFVEKGICETDRGKVKEVTMLLAKTSNPETMVWLTVNGYRYLIKAAGFPRINVGEEVILHLSGNKKVKLPFVRNVVGIEVLQEEEVVFRARLPHEEYHPIGIRYYFEDLIDEYKYK